MTITCSGSILSWLWVVDALASSNPTIRFEDILRHLFSELSPDQKRQVSKWDVETFLTQRRSSVPICALQRIKDVILDPPNTLYASLRAKSGLVAGAGHSDVVNLNGVEQTHEVRGSDAQENQTRKRSINASTAHEGEHNEAEPVSESSSDPCLKAFKKKCVSNAVHVCESSQRERVATRVSAGIPIGTSQDENLENEALVGDCEPRSNVVHVCGSSQRNEVATVVLAGIPVGTFRDENLENEALAGNCECAPSTECAPSKIIDEKHEENVGTEAVCNAEPSKKNTAERDEVELSSDSDDGNHNEMTSSSKKNGFVNSQCMQVQDSLFSLCVRCNEGGQPLICSSAACMLVVHQSCLGSDPSFDNLGNFYCPFCAYSRAMSEFREGERMASIARKDLSAFMGSLSR